MSFLEKRTSQTRKPELSSSTTLGVGKDAENQVFFSIPGGDVNWIVVLEYYRLIESFLVLMYYSVQFSHSVVSDSLWPHEA